MSKGNPKMGYVRSADNLTLALGVAPPYPQKASSPVIFQTVLEDEWNQPFAQWTFDAVDREGTVFQVRYYPSGPPADGSLCLGASAATEGSPVQVVKYDPTDRLQLWGMNTGSEAHYISCIGAPGMELGFPGDLPLVGMPLQLTKTHDQHDLGDKFVVAGLFF